MKDPKKLIESDKTASEVVNLLSESIFNDRNVDRQELVKVLDKHGISKDKIDDYSTDLFRLPDDVVTDELINDLNKIRAFRK